MGQYYKIVNLDKRQYLHPHKFGDGLKLLEFGAGGSGTMCGLAILLADGNGRGGGDLRSNASVIGSWAGDRIVIAGDICITVVGINRGKVRIGTTAPADVQVDRWEVFERRTADNADTESTPRQSDQPSDRNLQRRIVNFLRERSVSGLRQLEVEVCNGVAVIKGRVRTYYEKQLATCCCQRVAGVLEVINNVEVPDSGFEVARFENRPEVVSD